MQTETSNFLKIDYLPEIGAVKMEWTGFTKGNEFRQGNEKVLRFLKEKDANKLITDTRNMKIISISDQQWLYQEWLPRCIRAGLEFVALIESDDYFNKLSVDNVVQKINDKLEVRFFNNFLSAKNWLAQQQ